jgi:hypothetical protein
MKGVLIFYGALLWLLPPFMLGFICSSCSAINLVPLVTEKDCQNSKSQLNVKLVASHNFLVAMVTEPYVLNTGEECSECPGFKLSLLSE